MCREAVDLAQFVLNSFTEHGVDRLSSFNQHEFETKNFLFLTFDFR